MNESLGRIETDFDAFSRRIETYRESVSNPDRHKDSCEAAYEGLYKLMQRIKKELGSKTLNNKESKICAEIRDDRFFKGLLELRKIATHIQSQTGIKRGYVEIYAPSGQPVHVPYEVSAGSLFSNGLFTLPTPSWGINQINHLQYLVTAKERIGKKLKVLFSIQSVIK